MELDGILCVAWETKLRVLEVIEDEEETYFCTALIHHLFAHHTRSSDDELLDDRVSWDP